MLFKHSRSKEMELVGSWQSCSCVEFLILTRGMQLYGVQDVVGEEDLEPHAEEDLEVVVEEGFGGRVEVEGAEGLHQGVVVDLVDAVVLEDSEEEGDPEHTNFRSVCMLDSFPSICVQQGRGRTGAMSTHGLATLLILVSTHLQKYRSDEHSASIATVCHNFQLPIEGEMEPERRFWTRAY